MQDPTEPVWMEARALYLSLSRKLHSPSAAKKVLEDVLSRGDVFGSGLAVLIEIDKWPLRRDPEKRRANMQILFRSCKNVGELLIYPDSLGDLKNTKKGFEELWANSILCDRYRRDPLMVRRTAYPGLSHEVYGSRFIVYNVHLDACAITRHLSAYQIEVNFGSQKVECLEAKTTDKRVFRDWEKTVELDKAAKSGKLRDILGCSPKGNVTGDVVKALGKCFIDDDAPARATLYRRASHLLALNDRFNAG